MPRICEGRFVSIRGHDQWLGVRGELETNPGLFLIGGPGVALSRLSRLLEPLERDFTLIYWDQPGSGATASREAADGSQHLSLDRLLQDAICAVHVARETFSIERMALLGYSGGSVVGLQFARQRPDLICAYIGVGQFVNWRQQDTLSYDIILQDARARADQVAIADLERIGPPPYADANTDAVKSRYAGAATAEEQAAFAELRGSPSSRPQDVCHLPSDAPQPDQRRLALAAYETLRPELTTFDAATLGRDFGVAMTFFQGEHDNYAVNSVVRSYAVSISAPMVRYGEIQGGGHNALFLADRLQALLAAHVRPLFP